MLFIGWRQSYKTCLLEFLKRRNQMNHARYKCCRSRRTKSSLSKTRKGSCYKRARPTEKSESHNEFVDNKNPVWEGLQEWSDIQGWKAQRWTWNFKLKVKRQSRKTLEKKMRAFNWGLEVLFGFSLKAAISIQILSAGQWSTEHFMLEISPSLQWACISKSGCH